MVLASQHRRFYLITFIAGMLMPYFTGFIGLMPLDQSIIFEAGGRIMKGEVPYRDFYLPYGLVPSLMQSLFFKLLGVNWFAYVTHAALINGLFALLLFDCLAMLVPDAKRSMLAWGALLAAWAFYPTTGTPFLENHSLFFALAAYWCCLAAFHRRTPFLLAFIFPLMVPGFYAKPIPVVFFIIPVLLECWWNRGYLFRHAAWLIAGLVAAAAVMVLPALVFPADAFYYNTILLPFQLGKGRVEHAFLSRLVAQVKFFKILILCLVPLAVFLIHWQLFKNNRRLLIRAIIIILIALLFGILTKNNFYNITSPLFLFAAFLVHLAIIKAKVGRLPAIYRKFNGVVWMTLFVGITILNFRKIKDISFTPGDFRNYSTELGLFVKTPLNRYKKEDIEKLKGFINSHPVLYTGDFQFLFSMTGRDNPLPLTHINDRTTYDSRDTSRYIALKQQLLDNVLRNKATVYIEDESVYNPRQNLVYYLQPLKGPAIDSFAGITVYQLNRKGLNQLASSLKMSREK
jgi:hypothetical protein